MTVAGGVAGDMAPAAGTRGTRIEVGDLFYATPARLKFLKSERAEMMAVSDTLKRLAMAHAPIAFSLTNDGRQNFSVPAETGDAGQLNRLSAIMGRAFGENAVPVHAERDTLRLNGFAGLPTFNHATAQKQYLVVNGRPVRDKLLNGRCAARIRSFWPVSALRRWRGSSTSTRPSLTLMCIRQKRKCASATAGWYAA